LPDSFIGALQLTIIDMAVVFAVLVGLIVVIQATKAVLDRSQGRVKPLHENGEDEGSHEIVDLVSQTTAESQRGAGEDGPARLSPDAAPVPEPIAPGSEMVEPGEYRGLSGEVVAAIAAALHSYMGPAVPVQIRSITPVHGAGTDAWLVAGRGRLMRTGLGPRQRRSKSWRNVSE
jgi:Na+-transporting methylmalonyl-CoA/oxaloacetate decarboxylase gamma subunit